MVQDINPPGPCRSLSSLTMMPISSNSVSNQSNQSPWTSKVVTTFTRFINPILFFKAFQQNPTPCRSLSFLLAPPIRRKFPERKLNGPASVRDRCFMGIWDGKDDVFPWLRSIPWIHSWHSGRSLVLNHNSEKGTQDRINSLYHFLLTSQYECNDTTNNCA